MGRIVIHSNVTLDGVIQDPTGDEGFGYGGWFEQMPPDTRQEWAKIEFEEAVRSESLLFGLGTYRWFASRWHDREGEWADRLRSIPKFVVSSTIDEASDWDNTTVVKGDAVEAAAKLREIADGDIVVYGSAPLAHTLLDNDLVDEIRLMIHPSVLGAGERLFREMADQKPMQIADVRQVGTLILLTCQPATAS